MPDRLGINYQRAKALYQEGKYNDALRLCEQSILTDPKDSMSWVVKGYALLGLGLFDESLKAFERTTSLDASLATAWAGTGLVLRELHRRSEAIVAIEHALKLDPTARVWWYNLSVFLIEEPERGLEALQACERAINIDPKDSGSWKNKSAALLKLMRYDEALEASKEATKLDPTSVGGHFNKGRALEELGWHKEAVQAYKQAIALKGEYTDAWLCLGDVFEKLGSFGEAAQAYESARTIDPEETDAWIGAARALAALDQDLEALKYYDRALAIDPTIPQAWDGRGIQLSRLCREEEAIMAFERAAELAPQSPFPLQGKGNALVGLCRYEEAIEAFEQAIRLDTQYAEPWAGKGFVLGTSVKPEEALVALDKAIELRPGLSHAWAWKGSALGLLGRTEEALKAFKQAIGCDPKDALPWVGMGLLHAKVGELQCALPCFVRCYKLLRASEFSSFAPLVLPILRNNYVVPLLFHQVLFEDHCELLTHLEWNQLASVAEQDCREIVDLLDFVNSNHAQLTEAEVLRLNGLVYLFMGNPLRAYECLNRLDDIDDADLMGQYYLVQSLNGFEGDGDNELQDYVYQQTVKIFAAKRIISSQQLYYAGLIFVQQNDFDSAIKAFEMVSESSGVHLASLYMSFLCANKKKRYYRQNKLVDLIIQEESKLSEEGGVGFLGVTTFGTIDLSSPDWQTPFYKFANLMEISEALSVFYQIVEGKETQFEAAIHRLGDKLVGPKVSESSAIAAWRLHENSKAAIKKARAETRALEIKRQRDRLNVVFTNNIPFDEGNLPSRDIEQAVSRRIDEFGKGV